MNPYNTLNKATRTAQAARRSTDSGTLAQVECLPSRMYLSGSSGSSPWNIFEGIHGVFLAGLDDMAKADWVNDEAAGWAEAESPGNTQAAYEKRNALRHAYGAYLAYSVINEEDAEQILDNHENHGSGGADEAADRVNNEYGRYLAQRWQQEKWSDAEVKQIILDAYDNGILAKPSDFPYLDQ